MDNKLSSTNIVEILEAYKNNAKGLEEAIIGITKSVTNIANKVKINEFKKAKENTAIIIDGVSNYLTSISEVINELKNPKNGIKFDDAFAKQMLGMDANLNKQIELAQDPTTRGNLESIADITKAQSIPQQILAFSTVITDIYKSFDKLGQIAASPMSMIMLEVNMTFLKRNLTRMIQMMVDTLNSIKIDNAAKLLDVLVAQPEKTYEKIKYISNAKTGDITNDKINRTTKGRQGLMDVIMNFLNAFQILANLPVAMPGVFGIKMSMAMGEVKSLWKNISDFTKSSKFDSNNIHEMAKCFAEFNEVYTNIKMNVNIVKEIGTPATYLEVKMAAAVIDLVFGKGTKDHKSIAAIICKAVDSKGFKNATQPNITKQLEVLKNNIKKIKEMCNDLAVIGLMSIPLTLSLLGILLLKLNLELIFKLFNKDTLDKIKDSQEVLTGLSLVILSLAASVVYLALAGVLVIESRNAIMTVVLYLLIVTGAMFLIGLIGKLFKDLEINNTLFKLAATIAILAGTVVLLVLAGDLIMSGWKELGITLIYLAGIVAAFIILGLLSKFMGEANKSMMWLALSLVIMIGCVYLLIPAGILLAKYESDVWSVIYLMGALTLAVVGIALVSKFIKDGVFSLIIIAVTMLVVTGAVIALVNVADKITPKTWEGFGLMMAMIGSFVALATGLSFLPIVYVGAGILMMLAIEMLMITNVIVKIKDLNLDAKNDKDLLLLPVQMMEEAINEIAKMKTTTLLKGVAKITALMGAVIPISLMVGVLKDMADLRIPTEYDKKGKPIAYRSFTKDDFENAKQGILDIVDAFVTACTNPEIQQLSLDGIKESKKIFKQLAKITGPISDMVNVIRELANGEIDDYIQKGEDSNGNPIYVATGKKVNFIAFVNSHKADIEKNITTILTSLMDAVNVAMSDNNLNKKIANSKKTFEALLPLTQSISNIIGIGNINDKFDIEKHTKAVDNVIRLIDKANTINTDKIKTVTELFGKIAEFSKSIKGDFDKLADVLSEKLVDVLEKLHVAIQDAGKVSSTPVPTKSVNDTGMVRPVDKTNTKEQPTEKVDLTSIENELNEILNELQNISSRRW